MRIFALVLFVLFLLFAVFARWFFVCDILGQCQPEPPAAPVVEDIRAKTLQLTEDDRVILSGYDQFLFRTGEGLPVLNPDNQLFLDTLAALMLADTNKQLQLTGYFTPQEADIMAGFWEDMGLARAAAIRDLLRSRGISEQRIDLDHIQLTDSLLAEPVRFTFVGTAPDAYDTYAKETFDFHNMTYSDANFPSNGYIFTPTTAFVNYADSVKVYLASAPEKRIRLIGHTDSDGTDAYNQRLGMKRAESTRTYLKGLGITNSIMLETRGESEPIRPNDTPENKQKNRRINLIIE